MSSSFLHRSGVIASAPSRQKENVHYFEDDATDEVRAKTAVRVCVAFSALNVLPSCLLYGSVGHGIA